MTTQRRWAHEAAEEIMDKIVGCVVLSDDDQADTNDIAAIIEKYVPKEPKFEQTFFYLFRYMDTKGEWSPNFAKNKVAVRAAAEKAESEGKQYEIHPLYILDQEEKDGQQ